MEKTRAGISDAPYYVAKGVEHTGGFLEIVGILGLLVSMITVVGASETFSDELKEFIAKFTVASGAAALFGAGMNFAGKKAAERL